MYLVTTNIVGKDDPVTIADYAKGRDLMETPGWKRFRRYAKKEKKNNLLLKQFHLSAMRHRTAKVFKFGIRIPCDFEDAERLDRKNGNSLWKDAHALEMKQHHEYKTFESLGIGAPTPDDYEKVKLKIVYDCKHNYRRRA